MSTTSLEAIVPGQIWGAIQPLNMPGGIILDCRMTILRLDDDTLLMHSPITITDTLREQIDALPGTLRHIVAPSLFHHLFVRSAKQAFPDALTHAAPGLPQKRENFTFDHEIDPARLADLPWHDAIETISVAGMPAVNEQLFYHRPTRTIVVTDLVFNMSRAHNLRSALAFRAFGTHKRFAQSRLLKSMIKDARAYRASIQPIKALAIDRVVMAHGDVLATPDASQTLLRSLNLSS